MNIIWSLGLLVVIVLAFNLWPVVARRQFIRPTVRLVENLVAFAVKAVLDTLGAVFRIGGGSVKLPKSNPGKEAQANRDKALKR